MYTIRASATSPAGNITDVSTACTVPGESVTTPPPLVPGDVNGDGLADCRDLTLIRGALGSRPGDPRFSTALDLITDHIIDVKDLQFVAVRVPPGTVCK